ncbi:L-threonylcarbamoyladenylate synthase [Bdellovibrionota bacterium FG-2]
MIITVDPDYPNLKKVANAARFLKQGGMLAYPTDTTYGIGVDPFQPKAVSLLFTQTRRPPGKPASLLCSDITMVSQYAVISDRIFRAMKRALPGPFTFILPALKSVPRGLHGKRREVGIRVPAHPIVQELIKALGSPILNVSARNLDDHYTGDAREIEDVWGYKLDAVIDCGDLEPSESTVLDLVDDQPLVVREGLGDPALFLG